MGRILFAPAAQYIRNKVGAPSHPEGGSFVPKHIFLSGRRGLLVRAKQILHVSLSTKCKWCLLNYFSTDTSDRSRWPRVSRRGSAAARLLGLRVRTPSGHGCFPAVSVACCLCDGPIPRPQES